jgi:hypothetical protein
MKVLHLQGFDVASEVGGLLCIYEDSRLIDGSPSLKTLSCRHKKQKGKQREKAKGNKVHHWLTGSLVQLVCWCSTIPPLTLSSTVLVGTAAAPYFLLLLLCRFPTEKKRGGRPKKNYIYQQDIIIKSWRHHLIRI